MREEINGIVYDPEIYENSWPDVHPTWLWVQASPGEDQFRRAALVANSQYDDRSVILSDDYVPQEDKLGEIVWHQPENSEIYYVTSLFVTEPYSNSGIGYFLGVATHTWLAMNEVKMLMMPPPDPNHRVEFVERMIRKWCIEYQDDFTKFLDDDGNYYYYSEWAAIKGLL